MLYLPHLENACRNVVYVGHEASDVVMIGRGKTLQVFVVFWESESLGTPKSGKCLLFRLMLLPMI